MSALDSAHAVRNLLMSLLLTAAITLNVVVKGVIFLSLISFLSSIHPYINICEEGLDFPFP